MMVACELSHPERELNLTNVSSLPDPQRSAVDSRSSSSRVMLDEPSDVRLVVDAAAISGYEKVGADLLLQRVDGSIFHIQDFFKIGPNGEYSRLLGNADEMLVAGLMTPEPDYSVETPMLFSRGAGDAMDGETVSGNDIVERTSTDGVEGGGFVSFLEEGLPRLAGAGLMLGSGFVIPNENDMAQSSSDSPPVSQSEDEDVVTMESLNGEAELDEIAVLLAVEPRISMNEIEEGDASSDWKNNEEENASVAVEPTFDSIEGPLLMSGVVQIVLDLPVDQMDHLGAENPTW